MTQENSVKGTISRMIIEGHECSGKTTLAKGMANGYKASYFKPTQQGNDIGDPIRRLLRPTPKNKLEIWDRGWQSEYVYSRYFRKAVTVFPHHMYQFGLAAWKYGNYTVRLSSTLEETRVNWERSNKDQTWEHVELTHKAYELAYTENVFTHCQGPPIGKFAFIPPTITRKLPTEYPNQWWGNIDKNSLLIIIANRPKGGVCNESMDKQRSTASQLFWWLIKAKLWPDTVCILNMINPDGSVIEPHLFLSYFTHAPVTYGSLANTLLCERKLPHEHLGRPYTHSVEQLNEYADSTIRREPVTELLPDTRTSN